MDYIDQLARLRLSRQQAALLTQLHEQGVGVLVPWGVKPATRSEAAVTSRMLHRLKDRGFVKLYAPKGRARFTHLALTDDGRKLAELIEATVR